MSEVSFMQVQSCVQSGGGGSAGGGRDGVIDQRTKWPHLEVPPPRLEDLTRIPIKAI